MYDRIWQPSCLLIYQIVPLSATCRNSLFFFPVIISEAGPSNNIRWRTGASRIRFPSELEPSRRNWRESQDQQCLTQARGRLGSLTPLRSPKRSFDALHLSSSPDLSKRRLTILCFGSCLTRFGVGEMFVTLDLSASLTKTPPDSSAIKVHVISRAWMPTTFFYFSTTIMSKIRSRFPLRRSERTQGGHFARFEVRHDSYASLHFSQPRPDWRTPFTTGTVVTSVVLAVESAVVLPVKPPVVLSASPESSSQHTRVPPVGRVLSNLGDGRQQDVLQGLGKKRNLKIGNISEQSCSWRLEQSWWKRSNEVVDVNQTLWQRMFWDDLPYK